MPRRPIYADVGFPACPECLLWVNFNDCETQQNGDGNCDSDNTPNYTIDDGATEETADTNADMTTTGNAKIDNDATDYIRGDSWAFTFVDAGGGDRFHIDCGGGTCFDLTEGRCMFTTKYESNYDYGEDLLATSVIGGERWVMRRSGSPDEGFDFLWDYGATTFEVSGTTSLSAGRWYMIEFAYCDDAGTCSIGDDTIQFWIDGVSEGSTTDATNMTPLTSGANTIDIGRGGAGASGAEDMDVGMVVCTDDDAVDLWDRYAGTCTDGSTRCVDDAACGGGQCDNPQPQIDFPGAS
jgi:hypothetical protein